MLSLRVVRMAAAVLSVICLVHSHVEATGRADCPDYTTASGSTSTASTSGSASNASTAGSASSTTQASASSATNGTSSAGSAVMVASASGLDDVETGSESASSAVAAPLSSVTLYSEHDLAGDSFSFNITEVNRCYVLDCFSGVTQSAEFTAGDFFAFVVYADSACTAKVNHVPFGSTDAWDNFYSISPGSIMLWGAVSSQDATNGSVSACT